MFLPKHGKIDCRKCFSGCKEDLMQPTPDWKLRNDPGAWGNQEPEVLVLGFSKGSTQADIYRKGKFEDVAFGGPARSRLNEALHTIGLLKEDEHVTDKIEDTNSRFAFGSLVRCSLTRCGADDVHSSSGPLVIKSFKEIPQILDNCSQQFLANLPERTTMVVMLGVSDPYIKGCFRLLSRIYPEMKMINEVSYGDGKRLFVHITHPSPGNGHFTQWKEGHAKYDAAFTVLSQYYQRQGIPLHRAKQLKEHVTDKVVHQVKNFTNSEEVESTSPASVQYKHLRDGRIPVSTVKTGCLPFHIKQKSRNGYNIGENPVKSNGKFFDSYNEALKELRTLNVPGWRDYGNTSSAFKGIAWVTLSDAALLLDEKDKAKRIALFHGLKNVIFC